MRTDFSSFPTLHTERLVLREPTPTDAERYFHLRNDERTMAFIGRKRPQRVEEAAAMLDLLVQDRIAGERLGWLISLKDDPAMIGSVGLYKLKPEHHCAEAGYQLAHAHWGKGLMQEALNAVVHYAFSELRAHRVEAMTDPRNERSRVLLERCGFSLEGILRESFYWNGVFHGSAVYARLAPEA